jgi:hypothetical protein
LQGGQLNRRAAISISTRTRSITGVLSFSVST